MVRSDGDDFAVVRGGGDDFPRVISRWHVIPAFSSPNLHKKHIYN